MERRVTLVQLPPPGRMGGDRPGDVPERILQIVESAGGRSEGIWTLGTGPYRLVSVATYPDTGSATAARVRIESLGVDTVEGYPVCDMPECIQAMTA